VCSSCNNDDTNYCKCFSAASLVRVEAGAVVPYATLRVGDRVLSVLPDMTPSFETVFKVFRDPLAVVDFVRLEVASGGVLELTPGHLVYAGEECPCRSYPPALCTSDNLTGVACGVTDLQAPAATPAHWWQLTRFALAM
jgi:hypothetical protein